jgi:hypothetical protein
MTSDEALKILNLNKSTFSHQAVQDVSNTSESSNANSRFLLSSWVKHFKRYFEANDPSKGGSFYLQSKFYRYDHNKHGFRNISYKHVLPVQQSERALGERN